MVELSDAVDKRPTGQWCPIGPLQLHTWNYEATQCIWCGPDGLAWKPGRWIPLPIEGLSAWSASES